MGTEREFDAIFYDLGGTLRLVERDAAFEAEARRKIAEMCGEKGDPDEFCKFLDYRYAGYRKWCFETMREAPEEELWTKWLTPEYDRDLIKKNAIELTIEYRNKDGRRVVAPNGAQSIKDLYANGYKLGIISNLVTSQEIPRWLEADDLGKYFGAARSRHLQQGLRHPGREAGALRVHRRQPEPGRGGHPPGGLRHVHPLHYAGEAGQRKDHRREPTRRRDLRFQRAQGDLPQSASRGLGQGQEGMTMKKNIKAIFLDLGGTFREVDETNRPFIRQARERICELCGTDMGPDEFYDFLNARYDGYRNWALKYMCEAPETLPPGQGRAPGGA